MATRSHRKDCGLSSGIQRQSLLPDGDLSCQKGELAPNTTSELPLEDKHTEVAEKTDCNVGVSGRASLGQRLNWHTLRSRSLNRSSHQQHQNGPRSKKTPKRAGSGTRSSRVSALTQHQAVASRERTYECRNCGSRFTRSSSLVLHVKTRRREKPLVCTQCSQQFHTASMLLTHLALHA